MTAAPITAPGGARNRLGLDFDEQLLGAECPQCQMSPFDPERCISHVKASAAPYPANTMPRHLFLGRL